MTTTSLALVLTSAALHPLREFLIKGDDTPEGISLAVNIWFWALSGVHVWYSGMDPWTAFQVWPMMLVSGLGLLVYNGCVVATLRTGDISIYYSIIRSSPLFVVIVGFLYLGHSYSPMMLSGIVLVLIAAFLLQYQPGAQLVSQPTTLTLATLAMCGHGVVILADAEAMKHVDPAVFLFVMYIFVIPSMAVVFSMVRPSGRTLYRHLFVGWVKTPVRFASP